MKTTVGKLLDIVRFQKGDEVHASMKVFDFKQLHRPELLSMITKADLSPMQTYVCKIYLLDWFAFSDDADDDDGTFYEHLEHIFDSRANADAVHQLENTLGRHP